jgi:hypothetical protein
MSNETKNVKVDLEEYLKAIDNLVLNNSEAKEMLENKFSNYAQFPSYLRKTFKDLKIKARNYYKSIEEPNLKNQLVNDHVLMQWHRNNNQMELYVVYVAFQMESLLNHYCEKSSAFEWIYLNKDYYYFEYNSSFKVDVCKSFFTKKWNKEKVVRFEKKQNISKVNNIWAKYTYWMLQERGLVFDWVKANHASKVSTIVQVRNSTIHRGGAKLDEYFLGVIEKMKTTDSVDTHYYSFILDKLILTLDKLDDSRTPVKHSDVAPRSFPKNGPKVVGKIDLPS